MAWTVILILFGFCYDNGMCYQDSVHAKLMYNVLLTILEYCYVFVPSGDATVQLNITQEIPAHQMVTGFCTAYGKEYEVEAPIVIRIALVDKTVPCILRWKNNIEHLANSQYRNGFSIVCTESHAVKIRCHTNIMNEHDKVQVNIILPEPTEQPQIQTDRINVKSGQPITLRCETDNDPNHSWVGWFYRDSKIQEGDTDYSISTSPGLRLPNGAVSFLTVHSVRAAGKYSCQVYTINGNESRDQVDFQVNVSKDISADRDPSITIFDLLNGILG